LHEVFNAARRVLDVEHLHGCAIFEHRMKGESGDMGTQQAWKIAFFPFEKVGLAEAIKPALGVQGTAQEPAAQEPAEDSSQ
jgi:hypothetical protein